jgi:CubicO group peptidase (beta-lactamase class C family)
MTRPIALTLLALLSACSAPPEDTAPADAAIAAPESSFDKAAMDDLLSSAVERGDIIGVSALVYDEGQVVYENHFGLRDREADLPVTDDTVWRIYSMTKPIMSALIMDLMEDGLLALQDPVSKYIPELANMPVATVGEDGEVTYSPQSRPMTVEDLLLHRSGMSYGIFGGSPIEEAYQAANLFDANEGLGPKMERLSKLPLVAQPGDVWLYSYSIDVLGRIAEVVTQTPLDELMQARLLGPLKMTETGFVVTPEQTERFAAIYQLTDAGDFVRLEEGTETSILPDRTVDGGFYSGGGGLVSTLGDYANFTQMILDEGRFGDQQILEPETVALMTQDHMGEGFVSLLPWVGGDTGVGFGYGGAVVLQASPEQQASAGRFPGQWGWGGAARTDMYVDPENDAFGIIMLQFFSSEDPKLHADFQALALSETRDDTP